jgi:hypothetical protein
VLTLTTSLSKLRPYYTDETRELLGVLLNSTSAAEANLALEVLRAFMPEKSLVTACNLREVLRSLPCSPFMMHTDEVTLCKTARLERHMAAMKKTLPGGIELVVTTAGNLVLDLIVKDGTEKYFWTPIPVVDDFVNPNVVELVVTHGYLLDEVIELVKCMGIVFNPKFYLSLDDFHLENAADVFEGIGDLFNTPAVDNAFKPTSWRTTDSAFPAWDRASSA